MLTTDWSMHMLPGSLRGVPFWMAVEEESGGRRVVVHQFPRAEQHLVEDMGQEAATYHMTVYALSPGQAQALLAACKAPGPSLLVRPTFGPVMVQVQKGSISHDGNRLGYISIDIDAVAAPQGALGFSLDLPRALTFGFDALTNQLVGSFVQQFVNGTIGTFARDIGSILVSGIAGQSLVTMLDRIDAFLAGVALPLAITQEVADGLTLARDTASLPRFSARVLRAVGGSIRAVMTSVEPDIGLTALRPLAQPTPDLATADMPWGKSGKAGYAFKRATWTYIETLAAAACIRQEAVSRWSNRPDAVEARDRIRALFDIAAPRLDEIYGEGGFVALRKIRDDAVTYLSDRITSLVPIVRIDTGDTMPVSRISYELYGSMRGVDAILQRNGAQHPALMPNILEVPSP